MLHAGDFVDEPLGESHGGGAALAQVVEYFPYGGVEFVGGDRPIDQPQFRGSSGGEAIAAEKGLHGFAGAHLRQADHGNDGRDHAESNLGETKFDVFVGDGNVEGCRQAVATAHHVAGNFSNDGGLRTLDGFQEIVETDL